MRANKHKHTNVLLRGGRLLMWNTAQMAVLIVFLAESIFPARALAFVNDVELSHLNLIFVRDPTLMNTAIVGIEAWPKEKTVARLLKSSSLMVRSSLPPGSVVRVLSTAYSSTTDQTDDSPFITASGHRVGPGVMATNFLPFGARVRIGQQIYTVWDRMNSRYNEKYMVDIWQPTREKAVMWGARIVEMEIVSLP